MEIDNNLTSARFMHTLEDVRKNYESRRATTPVELNAPRTWMWQIDNLAFVPAFYDLLKKIKKKYPTYFFIPAGRKLHQQPYVLTSTDTRWSVCIQDKTLQTQGYYEPTDEEKKMALITSVAVCTHDSPYAVAVINMKLATFTADVDFRYRVACGSHHKNFQLVSPRINLSKFSYADIKHITESDKPARIVTMFNKVAKPIMGEEAVQINVEIMRSKRTAMANNNVYEINSDLSRATRALNDDDVHKVLIKLADKYPHEFPEPVLEKVLCVKKCQQVYSECVDVLSYWDWAFVQAIHGKIAVRRVSSDKHDSADSCWYNTFSELPDYLQEKISVLDIHNTEHFIQSVGVRFDNGYMVLIPQDSNLEGVTTYDS